MKALKIHLSGNLFLLFLVSFLLPGQSFACTIVSAISRNGHVWNMNNEDGPFRVANFINVFPKTANTYGYLTLSYFSPELGNGGSMQGGMNEAGLTFDFNAIERIKNVDPKKAFPEGDNAILPHILSTMSKVEEVIEFFQTYWFQNGFSDAQMHVADADGRFAIISASGIHLVEKGQPLVSTNFDICGNAESSSCWRYPIATTKISASPVDFDLMRSIALETAQKNDATMYSNIQNLSTGEIWFFSKHDQGKLIHTNIQDLLSRGQKSYSFSDLGSLVEERPAYSRKLPSAVEISDDLKQNNTGVYHNSYTGKIKVITHPKGLEITFADGRTELFYSENDTRYFIPDADVFIQFDFNRSEKRRAMHLYQNGYWTFSALRLTNSETSKF